MTSKVWWGGEQLFVDCSGPPPHPRSCLFLPEQWKGAREKGRFGSKTRSICRSFEPAAVKLREGVECAKTLCTCSEAFLLSFCQASFQPCRAWQKWPWEMGGLAIEGSRCARSARVVQRYSFSVLTLTFITFLPAFGKRHKSDFAAKWEQGGTEGKERAVLCLLEDWILERLSVRVQRTFTFIHMCFPHVFLGFRQRHKTDNLEGGISVRFQYTPEVMSPPCQRLSPGLPPAPK